MSFGFWIDDYPLQEHLTACRNYLDDVLDWDLYSQRISKEGPIWFDISDVMNLFPHLVLDERYRLICYLNREYHGIWGRVAAIKEGDPCEPKIIDGLRLPWGVFELPDCAVAPMEAIYHDKTPHGYLEAVLAKEFFCGIPYTRYEIDHWDLCVYAPPEDYRTNWNVYVPVSDLRPHLINTEEDGIQLCVCWFRLGTPFRRHEPKSSIRLTKYQFYHDLRWYYLGKDAEKKSWYKGRILDHDRYTDDRGCCVTSESSVVIARQK